MTEVFGGATLARSWRVELARERMRVCFSDKLGHVQYVFCVCSYRLSYISEQTVLDIKSRPRKIFEVGINSCFCLNFNTFPSRGRRICEMTNLASDILILSILFYHFPGTVEDGHSLWLTIRRTMARFTTRAPHAYLGARNVPPGGHCTACIEPTTPFYV